MSDDRPDPARRPSQWHVRVRYWFLLALTLLFIAGVYAASVNWKRVRAYRASGCEYSVAPYHYFGPLDVPDPDGLTRVRLPDGTLEIGMEKDSVRHGQWQTFDPSGVLREELLYENGRRTGPCRYYDAEGRLCAEGSWSGSGRRGIWTVYDIVGDGPRWIAFFE
jgi:hypothetical protein